MDTSRGRVAEVPITTFEGAERATKFDRVVTEEPLELRLVAGSQTHTLAVTMRTPGNDFELAAGFVRNEQVVRSAEELVGLSYCVDTNIDEEQRYNIVNVQLRAQSLPPLERFERHFAVNSSCGVCGRANLEQLEELGLTPLEDEARVPIETIYQLPYRMRDAQRIFSLTGGLHAAALFDLGGNSITVREDVGRHNALDKLCGWALIERRSLQNTIVFVSGRASYEILQKAAVARIPIVCSVSAPSSLAVELAQRFNITLLGFVRGERANVYSIPERITG